MLSARGHKHTSQSMRRYASPSSHKHALFPVFMRILFSLGEQSGHSPWKPLKHQHKHAETVALCNLNLILLVCILHNAFKFKNVTDVDKNRAIT